mmetsp:Transcript_46773/g.109108  ORF Transcript_46773/g.109108 Transcript_46773/m.109108 type:complete len:378 (-) Transcript_46773:127-1260(-)
MAYTTTPAQVTTSLFDMLDRNHDGKITRSEFAAAVGGTVAPVTAVRTAQAPVHIQTVQSVTQLSQSPSVPTVLSAPTLAQPMTTAPQVVQISPSSSSIEVVPSKPHLVHMQVRQARASSPPSPHVSIVSPPVPVRLRSVEITMEGQIQQLQNMLAEETAARQRLEMAVKQMLVRLDKLDPPETALRAAVRKVEARGNISVDHTTGHVSLVRPIDFIPKNTKNEPIAEFKHPGQADEICRDVAEVARLFECPMMIEGHTKGGESTFWMTLAQDRARAVRDKILAYGGDPDKISSQGLPGRLGKNEVRTEIYMDISNIADEQNAAASRLHMSHMRALPSTSNLVDGATNSIPQASNSGGSPASGRPATMPRRVLPSQSH